MGNTSPRIHTYDKQDGKRPSKPLQEDSQIKKVEKLVKLGLWQELETMINCVSKISSLLHFIIKFNNPLASQLWLSHA